MDKKAYQQAAKLFQMTPRPSQSQEKAIISEYEERRAALQARSAHLEQDKEYFVCRMQGLSRADVLHQHKIDADAAYALER